MAAKIFISYRRRDSNGEARVLAQQLGTIYGEDGVFLDATSRTLGVFRVGKRHTAVMPIRRISDFREAQLAARRRIMGALPAP